MCFAFALFIYLFFVYFLFFLMFFPKPSVFVFKHFWTKLHNVDACVLKTENTLHCKNMPMELSVVV